ncbi:MAG: lipocalin family protein [Bacteroidales bacterium]|nr:lipocalin family protein [Bacteroidales bacterium]
MKKINFFAVLFAALALVCSSLVSCNKDDDAPNISAESLVGTWKQVSYEEWWDNGDGDKGHNKIICDEDNDWAIMTFNEDGTYTERYKEKEKGSSVYTNSGYWKVVKNRLYMSDRQITDEVIKEMNEDGEYTNLPSISGKTMTCTYEDREDGEYSKEVEVWEKQ